jgi:LEA14-like dessication related protein
MTLLLGLLACNGGIATILPTVSFQRLRVNDVNFESVDVDFVFAVDNPNPVGFPLHRFSYALDLAGVELLSGENPDGLELEAQGSSDVALPVVMAFASIFEVVEAARGSDTLPFALRGDFGWDTDLGPVDVSFDEGGDFPALRKPRVDLGQLRLGGISGSSVAAELDLGVDNDHGSPLGLKNLDFDLAVAGSRVGGGNLEDGGQVDGATQRTLTLPLVLDLIGAGEAVAAAVSGERVRVGLSAALDVDTPFGTVPLALDPSGSVSVRQD